MQGLEPDDLKKIGSAPLAVRALVLALGFAAIIGVGFWMMVVPKFNELDRTASKEQTLKTTFDTTQAKAANREAYVEQLSEMKRTFNVMLRQLPDKTDIESLLIDLSQTSVAAGLDVEYFKPENEVTKAFYVEYPIRISVTGNYHQFGNFVSGLAALPRIVTLHDIAIQPIGGNQPVSRSNAAHQKLKMDLIATTYRYLEEDEG
ncbi:hypothetical protein AB833_30085 [Chromatiales bacterium (ex Bugula neritina AB1)]|nr:hypothetical protein AB833_30085 [Chromatiales bacterium (ex Bugula neritina AB1)]